MPRTRRHKHHGRKSRSNWAIMGAFMASAAFAPPLAAKAHATDLGRRLESLRIAVPGETRLARALANQAPAGDQRQMRFDIPAGPLRTVLAEIERISGLSIALTNPAISDISSGGVSGLLTPLEAIARRPAGHERHLSRDRAEQRLARDSSRCRSGRRDCRCSTAPAFIADLLSAAHRGAADDRSDSTRSHGSAGRDDVERSAPQRPGHQPPGRRGRRRVEYVG